MHGSGPGSEVESSEVEDSDASSIANVLHEKKRVVISQAKSSRPVSSIIDISGNVDDVPVIMTEGVPSLPPLPPPDTLAPDTPPSSSPEFTHLVPQPPTSLPPPGLMQPPSDLVRLEFQLRNKARGGLGITIVAPENSSEKQEHGVFIIRRISPGGVAAKDGRLRIGDQLRSVNGLSLLNLSHAEVLQAVNEAHKEMELIVWRNPHQLASSSLASLGSCSNMSGSHSSIDVNGESSPTQGKPKRLRLVPSPQGSPLVTRFSFAAFHTPPQRESPLPARKRWSTGNVLDAQSASEATLSSEFMPDPEHDGSSALPLISEPEMSPPGIPDTPPPEVPRTPSPEASGSLSSELPGTPPSYLLDTLPGTPPTKILWTSPSELPETPPLTIPDLPPPEVPDTPPPEVAIGKNDGSVSSPTIPNAPPSIVCKDRPESLKVPYGERLEKSPFEIELSKGLFGIGAKLIVDSMGMLAIKSLTARSVILKDNNIRYIHAYKII